MAPTRNLATLLRQTAQRYGSLSALGRATGIHPATVSKLVRHQGSLDVAACLRFAQVTGENPTTVLQAAGKGNIAALIEAVYTREGRAAPPIMLPAEHREIIAILESIHDPEHKRAAVDAMRYVAHLSTQVQTHAVALQQLEAERQRLLAEVARLETGAPARTAAAASAPKKERRIVVQG